MKYIICYKDRPLTTLLSEPDAIKKFNELSRFFSNLELLVVKDHVEISGF